MDITVFVPTRGRTAFEPITLMEVTRKSSYRPVVVCPASEEKHYNRHFDVLVCPHDGIGPTRQFILENSPTRGVVMLDDDMYFSVRQFASEPIPLLRANDLHPMFDWIKIQLDSGFAHGGISARQGNNHIPREHVDCIRVNNAHFFDRDVYLHEQLQFHSLPVMEDFYITLKLLLRGYPNRVAYHYCWSQRSSGFKGGCSIYRTPELQAQAAETLASYFPDYVRVVEKRSESQSGAMAVRKDVNISWLKAWGDRENRIMDGYTVGIPNLARK